MIQIISENKPDDVDWVVHLQFELNIEKKAIDNRV
jgi:hypothetical protein